METVMEINLKDTNAFKNGEQSNLEISKYKIITKK